MLVLALGLAALIAGWVYCRDFTHTSGKQAPTLEVEQNLDLGERELLSRVNGSIVLRNTGDQVLVIDGIVTRCGGLGVFIQRGSTELAKVERLEIPPHTKQTLVVQLAVAGSPGVPLVRRFAFQTNDPNRPSVEITLTVTPTSRYFATPAEVSLGTLSVGDSVQREIEIRAYDRKLPPITRVTCSLVRTEVDFQPGKKPANALPDLQGSESIGLLRVAFDKTTAPGDVSGTIFLFCEGEEKPVIELPVSGHIAPLVELSPGTLLLPRVSGAGATYRGNCICRSPSGKPLSLRISKAPPKLVVRIKDVPANRALKLIEVDATSIAQELPPAGPPQQLELTAEVDGRRMALKLMLVLKRP